VSPSPSASRQKLGRELKAYREKAGLLIEHAATALECSQSKVSRLENGKGIPRTRDVRDLLGLYRVIDEAVRNRLLELASDGQAEEWWSEYRDVVRGDLFADHLLPFAEAEQEATALRSFEPELFPGLLQSAPYIEAMAAFFYPDSEEGERRRWVEFRLRRQHVLRSAESRTFEMVVGEAALLRAVGGPRAMGAQLEHVHKSMENDLAHVDFRILPFDIAPAASIGGPFVVMRFVDGRRDCVYLEARESASYVRGEDKLDAYDRKFEELATAALDREASLARLAEVRQHWQGRS